MRITGFRCDGCGTEIAIQPALTIEHYMGVVPDGWYMVTTAERGSNNPWLFCSWDCIQRHAMEMSNEQEGTQEASATQ